MVLLLPDRDAADGVPDQVVLAHGLDGRAPQVLEDAPLHDSEQGLSLLLASELPVVPDAAFQPAVGPLGGRGDLAAVRGSLRRP